MKEKCLKIELEAGQDSLEPKQTDFRKNWDCFELILQNLIFALQTIGLFATHSKLSKQR